MSFAALSFAALSFAALSFAVAAAGSMPRAGRRAGSRASSWARACKCVHGHIGACAWCASSHVARCATRSLAARRPPSAARCRYSKPAVDATAVIASAVAACCLQPVVAACCPLLLPTIDGHLCRHAGWGACMIMRAVQAHLLVRALRSKCDVCAKYHRFVRACAYGEHVRIPQGSYGCHRQLRLTVLNLH